MNNKVLVGVLISLIVILFGLLGYYMISKSDNKISNKDVPIKEEWGETYYAYLRDNKDVVLKDKENPKVKFINTTKQEKPVMVIKYEKDKREYSNVYYIKGDKVNTIIYDRPVNISYLYNMEQKTYNYYFHLDDSKKDYYQTIDSQIEANKKEEGNNVQIKPEFTFDKKTVEKFKNSSGEEIAIGEFEKKLIVVESEEKYIDLDNDMNEAKIKEAIVKSISTYVTKDNLVDDKFDEIIAKRQKDMKEYAAIMDKKAVDNFYKKIVKGTNGYFTKEEYGGWHVVRIVKQNGKYYFDEGYYMSEGIAFDEIDSVTYKGNNIYQIKFKKVKLDIDITNINKNKIKINNKTFTYYTEKQIEKMIFG